MGEAWRTVCYATDTFTGKVIVLGTIPSNGTLVNGAGQAFERNNAAYTVTAGKVLHINAIQQYSAAGMTAGSFYELRYADDAALTTNPVTLTGLPRCNAGGTAQDRDLPLGDLQVPAGHYIGIFNASGTNQAQAYVVVLYGYEV